MNNLNHLMVRLRTTLYRGGGRVDTKTSSNCSRCWCRANLVSASAHGRVVMVANAGVVPVPLPGPGRGLS